MNLHEFLFFLPEIVLCSMASLILLLGVFIQKKYSMTLYYLSSLALWGGIAISLYIWQLDKVSFFSQLFVVDNLSVGLKLVAYIVSSFILYHSKKYLLDNDIFQGEYFALSLFSVLGLSILVSSSNFLTIYLGLELLTMPLYGLIAMNKKKIVSSESAIKYLVLSAMASGMFLYGISLLYGVSHTIELSVFSHNITALKQIPDTLWFGIVFVMIGFAFKLGAVPFHMWVPDVYQGAPLSVLLLISTLPKIAAFGMAVRVLLEAFSIFTIEWKSLIAILAIASLVVGNLSALFQSNIKRLLGYSAIAHIGFVLLGLVGGARTSFAESLFYLLIYTLMILGVLACLLTISSDTQEIEDIEDLRGLGQKNPMVSAVLCVLFLSLMGIPPTAGFVAKFFILQDLLNNGQFFLALSALLLTVIAAYYYLKMIKVMYFVEKTDLLVSNVLNVDTFRKGVLLTNGMLVLILGIAPMYLLDFCVKVLQK